MPDRGANGRDGDDRADHGDDRPDHGGDRAGRRDDHAGDGAEEQPLPEDVVEEAERLTRLARRAADDAEAAAYREERAELLAEHDYAALVRSEGDGDVLVCHPEEWLADGDVVPERIDDVDRGVEVPLEGAGDPDSWAAVAETNDAVAETVREVHGDVHGENAAELAEFASNHCAKRIGALTADELRHFREEYYVRNVWPSDEQADVLERSIDLVYEELPVPRPDD